MTNRASLERDCRAFLNKKGFTFKNGGWRMWIRGDGMPLTQREQEANQLGGKLFGTTALGTVGSIAIYENFDFADEARQLFNKHGAIPAEDGDYYTRASLEKEGCTKIIEKWDAL